MSLSWAISTQSTPPSCFLKIHFSISLPSKLTSSMGSQVSSPSVYVPLLCTCHMPRPSLLPLLYYPQPPSANVPPSLWQGMFHSHGNEKAEYYAAKFLLRTTLLTGTGASFYPSTSAYCYQCHSTTATYSFTHQWYYRITRIDSIVKQDITKQSFLHWREKQSCARVRHEGIWSLKLWPFYSTENTSSFCWKFAFMACVRTTDLFTILVHSTVESNFEIRKNLKMEQIALR